MLNYGLLAKIRAPMLIGALIMSAALPFAEPTSSFAQPPAPSVAAPHLQEIRPGSTVHGTLSATDSQVGLSYHDDYLLHLEAGQAVQIDLDSPDPQASASPTASPAPARAQGFDTVVEVRRQGNDEPLAFNDDRADSLNSRLVFVAPVTGDYVVRARAYYQGTGSYVLAVQAVRPPPEPSPIVGESAEGDLNAESPVDQSSGWRYGRHSFTGSIGERIDIELASSGRIEAVELFREDGRSVAIQHVGGSETHLLTVLPAAGRYIVAVKGPANSASHYVLNLKRAMADPPRHPRSIHPGETVRGELTITSPGTARPDGSGQVDFFYGFYVLHLRRGDTVTVSLDAQGFDPVLDAGTLSVLGFDAVLTDDDSGPDHGSRLVLQPLRSGNVYLRVRSLGLHVGSYQLSVGPILPGGLQ